MATPHIPNLSAIKTVEDPEVAFYAVVGAAMSLAANLELSYFRVFYGATGLAKASAARVFYAVRNASTRRDMADAAIRPTLSDEARAEWIKIYGGIVSATGTAGHRNLIGHARVSRQEATDGPFDPEFFDPAVFDTGTEEQFFVEQDDIQVMAQTQKPRKEDFDSLLAYCRRVIDTLIALEDFMDAYESGDLRGK
jgi:hypothetical protein